MQVDAAVASDGAGELLLVGGFDEFLDEFRRERVFDPIAFSEAAVPRPISRCDFPVPESPMRQSGSRA
jgi:hypothetical protein